MDEVTTPKPIQRHPDKLVAKARTHLVLVDDITRGRYTVVSGGKVKAGGNSYTVNVFANGEEASCNCDWATKRVNTLIENQGAVACSHTIAVFEFIALGGGRKVSAHATEEAAQRQHRPMVEMKDGVILTTRPATKRVQANFFWLLHDTVQ